MMKEKKRNCKNDQKRKQTVLENLDDERKRNYIKLIRKENKKYVEI